MIIVPNPVGPILIVENADSTKLAVKSPGGVYTELSSTVLRVLSCGHEWGGAESERDASGTSLREVGEGAMRKLLDCGVSCHSCFVEDRFLERQQRHEHELHVQRPHTAFNQEWMIAELLYRRLLSSSGETQSSVVLAML